MKNTRNKQKLQKQFSSGHIDVPILHKQQIIYTIILEVAKLKHNFLASVTSHQLHTNRVENTHCGGSSINNFIFWRKGKKGKKNDEGKKKLSWKGKNLIPHWQVQLFLSRQRRVFTWNLKFITGQFSLLGRSADYVSRFRKLHLTAR